MAEKRNEFTSYLTTTTGFGKTVKEALGSANKLLYDGYCVDALGTTPIYFNYTLDVGPVTMQKYIINEGATIIFWKDGSKTVSKRDKNDKFDKELGFLFAYFYKFFKGSKASRKRVIDCVEYKNIKTFLFEFYVNHSGKTAEQAKKYLQNLEVAK